jgi:hypothetical protein
MLTSMGDVNDIETLIAQINPENNHEKVSS